MCKVVVRRKSQVRRGNDNINRLIFEKVRFFMNVYILSEWMMMKRPGGPKVHLTTNFRDGGCDVVFLFYFG